MESKKLIAENRAAAVTATLPKLNKATATALAAAVAQQKEEQKNNQHHHASRKIDKKKTPQAKSVVAPPPPPLNPLQVMKLEVIEAFQAREKKQNDDDARDQRHRDLQAVVDRLQEALLDEQKEKTRLRGLTASLRHRVETVRAACGTLDRQRVQYETFRDAAKVARELRSPEMLAPTGLLTFANMEGGDRRSGGGGATGRSSKPATPASSVAPDNSSPASPGRSNFALPGRSAKRTAYCTDYGNTRYLGIREADAKEELQRRICVLLKERDDLAAATAGTVGANNNNTHQHSGSTSSPHREEYRGLSIYGYRGADSRLNLDEFRKRSSRRTKMYRDYEGNFIQMDSCDWPMTDGVNF
ncbi:Hypothetical protein, putative [Bodo saltans]|uniref:Uncharacterized protein n=1 Tax=Bodo saltans TaxID=75058 RepID=A0A0S4JFC5_BODSA|nr:Hypothetical protein, putative [Bodo saltans]|eukprot:CUG90108.1 Hypothetical protein, putative [Bodo saltans]